jgi:hypothetical protein
VKIEWGQPDESHKLLVLSEERKHLIQEPQRLIVQLNPIQASHVPLQLKIIFLLKTEKPTASY